MSMLNHCRSCLKREQDKASKYQHDIATLAEKTSRKQVDLSKAKTPSQTQSLTREIQTFLKQRATAESGLATAQKQIGDYSARVFREEQNERAREALKQQKIDREIERARKEMERKLAMTSTAVGVLHVRVSEIEGALLTKVHDAIVADNADREFDIFLCHADSDKDEATKFYDELTHQGMNVWFDREEVSLGLSLFRQLNRGTARSHAGIGLITEAFLQGGYWSEMEIGSFLSTQRRFIPILHGVDRSDLKRYSPFLADLGGLSTDGKGFDAVAATIAATVRKAEEDAAWLR